MKYFIIFWLLIFIISIECKSQRWDYIPKAFIKKDCKNEWGNDSISPDTRRTLSEKLYLLKGSNYCGKHGDIMDEGLDSFINEHSPNIHFIDLNKNGTPDLIYDGLACPGFESGQVDIYENTGDSLIVRLNETGKMICYDPKSSSFVTYGYPCCDEVINEISFYSYGSVPLKIVRQRPLEIYISSYGRKGTSLPDSFNTEYINILIKSQPLRWSPKKTYKDDYMMCENNDSNIIMTLYPGSKAIVLSESQDMLWLFVKIDWNIDLPNNCINEMWKNHFIKQNTKDYSIYGWIEK
jgi:hypothetical protein